MRGSATIPGACAVCSIVAIACRRVGKASRWGGRIMTELSPGAGNAAGPVVASGRASVGSRKIPGSDSLISIAAFAVLLVVWEIAVRVLQVPDYILPAPSAISMSLFYGL